MKDRTPMRKKSFLKIISRNKIILMLVLRVTSQLLEKVCTKLTTTKVLESFLLNILSKGQQQEKEVVVGFLKLFALLPSHELLSI